MNAPVSPRATVGERASRAFAMLGRPESDAIGELVALYADDVVFEDPFHRIAGRDEAERALRLFTGGASAMRCVVRDLVESKETVAFTWQLRYVPRLGPAIVFEGATFLRLDGERVVYHRDHWDSFETLGKTMPLLPRLLRALVRAPK